ncbi:MAG: MqnA/MqnD/SBP family protein [Chlorobiota bacterium]
MRFRLAAPADPLYDPLVAASTDRADIRLLRVSPEACAELLMAGRVEAALLSPLDYGKANGIVDYRILPGPALAFEGYTQRVWLYFRPGLRTITRCATPSTQHFLAQALRLLFAEAYDTELQLLDMPVSGVSETLHSADAVLSWREDLPNLSRLDIGEEWFSAFGYALPIAFWSCRAEVASKELVAAITELAHPQLPESEAVTEPSPYRQGTIHWRWNETVGNALRETLLLLYYHQLVPHISEVKPWDGSMPE